MEFQYTEGVCNNNLSNDEFNNLMLTAEKQKGTCIIDSWIIWQKLLNLKPKRVRGLINNMDVIAGSFDKTEDITRIHYWVEAKGMVYDITKIQTIILPINKYYEVFKISDAEIASNGVFTDNYKTLCGRDNIDNLEKHIIPERANDIQFI